jgi:hypothetical protein
MARLLDVKSCFSFFVVLGCRLQGDSNHGLGRKVFVDSHLKWPRPWQPVDRLQNALSKWKGLFGVIYDNPWLLIHTWRADCGTVVW